MNSSTVLFELKELRDAWKRQGFVYTTEQQKSYDELLTMRRARVAQMYEEDLVYKSSAK